jgi:hypothetical protein
MGQIFRWSYSCAAGLPSTSDVSHDCYRSPKQRQKGNNRDEEEYAHTCLLRIPKPAVRNPAEWMLHNCCRRVWFPLILRAHCTCCIERYLG